ncbi:ABC transporter permease [Vagococcus acidifermentans]|uniref:ABC transporter permease n=1 Tax=Vagococcus acidifermentans TaxID=564710 RepID=A0A430AXQ6_9ENTE|nr:ABC transporter permease [Vagococcus acidifermentans]RSU12847.1 ABC transporter permease [Vagococcus acidifermentans]
MILSSISQGLLWSIMAIGVYITFRILDMADLTAEGSFTLGASVSAAMIVTGNSPVLATISAFLCGLAAGCVTGLLHTALKIPSLVAGILTMTGLYSVNLRVMGKSNIGLALTDRTLMTFFLDKGMTNNQAALAVGLIVVAIVVVLLYFLFQTSLGLAIRSTGDNEEMSLANGINTNRMKVYGFMLSNGLIALCGALMMQNNGYADSGMGIGTIVIGLASIIVGEVLLKNVTLVFRFLMTVAGSIIYRLIIVWVMNLSFVNPNDLRLFSAIILTLALATPLIKKPNGTKHKQAAKR